MDDGTVVEFQSPQIGSSVLTLPLYQPLLVPILVSIPSNRVVGFNTKRE